jgi:hypothetical protein
MSLLDDLKRQAADIIGQNQSDSARLLENAALIDPRMQKLFIYLSETTTALNVIQPRVPEPLYLEPSLGLEQLNARNFFIESRKKRLEEKKEVFDNISFSFRYQGPGKVDVKKEFHQVDAFRQLLVDNGVVHEVQEFKNERARVTHAMFHIEATVRANLVFEGRYEEGTIRCRAKNIGRLGVVERDYHPNVLEENLLEELIKGVLGQPNNFGVFSWRSDPHPPA